MEILAWIMLGVMVDICLMFYLKWIDNNRKIEWYQSRGLRIDYLGEKEITLKDKIKETPWWAHVIIVLVPIPFGFPMAFAAMAE